MVGKGEEGRGKRWMIKDRRGGMGKREEMGEGEEGWRKEGS